MTTFFKAAGVTMGLILVSLSSVIAAVAVAGLLLALRKVRI